MNVVSQGEDEDLLADVAKLLQGLHLHSQNPFIQLVTEASDLKNLQDTHAHCLEERLARELVSKTELYACYLDRLTFHLFCFLPGPWSWLL